MRRRVRRSGGRGSRRCEGACHAPKVGGWTRGRARRLGVLLHPSSRLSDEMCCHVRNHRYVVPRGHFLVSLSV